MKQENGGTTPNSIDNALDVQGLFCRLWRGKRWIIACAAIGVLGAMLYALLAHQQWSTTAITDRPTVNMLGKYYSQQQFLHNLDLRTDQCPPAQSSTMDDVYHEFIMQLSSWDTRRDFWLQTDYYRQRQSGNSKADAALLNEMINNIVFMPGDALRNVSDSVRLVAETASDANNLLRQYVAFASQRAATHLNDQLKGAWAAQVIALKAQVQRQTEVAQAIYSRKVKNLEQALNVAQSNNINREPALTPDETLSDSELFILGKTQLQARLENLKAVGPSYERTYDRDRSLLASLNAGPILDPYFQTYRYLRTPEEPVKRDSPRRGFLMAMWGIVGALVGAGIAISRRPKGNAKR